MQLIVDIDKQVIKMVLDAVDPEKLIWDHNASGEYIGIVDGGQVLGVGLPFDGVLNISAVKNDRFIGFRVVGDGI